MYDEMEWVNYFHWSDFHDWIFSFEFPKNFQKYVSPDMQTLTWNTFTHVSHQKIVWKYLKYVDKNSVRCHEVVSLIAAAAALPTQRHDSTPSYLLIDTINGKPNTHLP